MTDFIEPLKASVTRHDHVAQALKDPKVSYSPLHIADVY